MLMSDIITKKRDKGELSKEEIDFFVSSASNQTVPDYQLSAMLMAIFLNGMTENETTNLTIAMAKSGDMLNLTALGDKTVDKHSTGGVGDKTTLICAPIAAALGCKVAKMSGRGLGHTGGTVDKLESIPGYRSSLSVEEFISNTDKYGICVVGQSGNFAPADKKLYALRDVTATVESIPLIASSVMSKKLAAGAKNLVLDVKFGSGAFMKTPEQATALAEEMVKIGKNAGRNTMAIITDMDIPLGSKIGNSLEVEEAVDILRGNGDSRLSKLSVILAANMHSLSFGVPIEESILKAKSALADGSAFKKLCEMVKNQGGDLKYLKGESKFPESESSISVKAINSGYISKIDSYTIGKAALLSGAGRETLNSQIDSAAGIILLKQYGEYVEKGDIIAEIRGKKERLSGLENLIASAFEIEKNEPPKREVIYKIIK